MGRIVVGTSSWADPGFVQEWYPPGLAASARLPWYAERFEGVEVNSTFYAVPAARTVRRWAQLTPADFSFDVKLHRLLSRHSTGAEALPRELRPKAEVGERGRVVLTPRLEGMLLTRIRRAVEPLGEKLATFLLQLSPAFQPRKHELDELLGLLDRLGEVAPVAIELRHRGWLDEDRVADTLGWYEQHGVAFVCVDAPRGKSPTLPPLIDVATNDEVAYLRAHGRNLEGYTRGRTVAERFAYRYRDEELEQIGERATALAQEVASVRLMFNNNRGSDAPVAAERMRELLGQTSAVG